VEIEVLEFRAQPRPPFVRRLPDYAPEECTSLPRPEPLCRRGPFASQRTMSSTSFGSGGSEEPPGSPRSFKSFPSMGSIDSMTSDMGDLDLNVEMDTTLKLTAAASLFAFAGLEGGESGSVLLEGVPKDVAQDLGFGARAARALVATPPPPPPPSLCISR